MPVFSGLDYMAQSQGKPPISTLIAGKAHIIGAWDADRWKGREEFTALASVWSQMMGILNAHRDRELAKLKPENRNRGPEGPSEMQARLKRTGQQLKAVAAAEQRVKDMRAWFAREAESLPMLRPDRGDLDAALVRSELRKSMAQMKPSELVATLQDPSDEFLIAALGAPPELKLINSEMRTRLIQLSIDRANTPEKLGELRAINEAIQVAENAVNAAHAATRDGLTMQDERELGVIAAEAAA